MTEQKLSLLGTKKHYLGMGVEMEINYKKQVIKFTQGNQTLVLVGGNDKK